MVEAGFNSLVCSTLSLSLDSVEQRTAICETLKMQQRKLGRPLGTDGSDFSFRMVVDSRYTKVAKGKSRLRACILILVVIQVVQLLCVAPFISKGKKVNTLAVSSCVIGLISLLLGEMGRRYSKASLLRVFMLFSSISAFTSAYCAASNELALKVISSPSLQELKSGDILDIAEMLLPLLGLPIQIFTITTVFTLIGNMSPPKKTS